MRNIRRVGCQPNVWAVSGDPGPSYGAAALIRTDHDGRARPVRVVGWARDKRKQPRNVFRWVEWTPEGLVEVERGARDPLYVVSAIVGEGVAKSQESKQPLSCAVEAIQSHGPPRRGLLDLAASAGAAAGLCLMDTGNQAHRPPERQWVRQVAAVPSRTRKKETRQMLACALQNEPRDSDGLRVSWGFVVDCSTITEHMMDAIGIALFAADGHLCQPQERQHV